MTVTSNRESRVLASNTGFSNPIYLDQYVEQASHIEVYADTELLALGDDYTLSGLGDEDGLDVTITTEGLTHDPETWVVFHNPPMEQGVDLSLGGAFGLAYENALDALTRRMQSIIDKMNRSVGLALDTPLDVGSITFPAPAAGRGVKWNDTGTALISTEYDPDEAQTDAGASADAAAASAAVATAKEILTTADVVQTAADRVQTGLDRTAAAGSAVTASNAAGAAAADAVATAADAVATAADRVQTGLDRTAAAASAATATAKELLTDADATQTAADRVQTGLDKVATAADLVQTGLDKVATAADRVQTGLDVTAAAASAAAASVLTNDPGFLFGCTLSNNVADASNDIDIEAGVATLVNAGGAYLKVVVPARTKQLDALFAHGTAAGGRDTGSIADGTWHVFVIHRTSTGHTDYIFSQSATTPTFTGNALNYDYWRRIGSFMRTGGVIVPFWQDGDVFQLRTHVTEANVASDYAWGLLTLTGLPSGIKVQPLLYAVTSSTSGNSYMNIGDARDTAATSQVRLVNSPNGTSIYGNLMGGIFTDTARQIHWSYTEVTTGTGLLHSRGWIDARGRT